MQAGVPLPEIKRDSRETLRTEPPPEWRPAVLELWRGANEGRRSPLSRREALTWLIVERGLPASA